jgi:anthranilate/para-aminobenzoate synthase component II
MAFRHKYLTIWAVQFHPESSQTVFGIEIIRNFVNQVAKTKLLQT